MTTRGEKTLLRPFALSIDVEEWYHTCLVPSYVDPRRRPASLVRELDWLLPEILELLESAGATATFFVLGEVAEDLPKRIREISEAGHEVASHCFYHFRVNELDLASFSRDALRSKVLLEDLTGQPVIGFRAPEWSMRRRGNPRLGVLAELGYRYDSSLAPYWGAGSRTNSKQPHWLEGPDLGQPSGSPLQLLELPPLTLGRWLRLPAGSWTGRPASAGRVLAAGRALQKRGGLALLVVHPWELSARPTPGQLPTLAHFVHEIGRQGYRQRFDELLAGQPFSAIRDALDPDLSIELRDEI